MKYIFKNFRPRFARLKFSPLREYQFWRFQDFYFFDEIYSVFFSEIFKNNLYFQKKQGMVSQNLIVKLMIIIMKKKHWTPVPGGRGGATIKNDIYRQNQAVFECFMVLERI